MDPNKEIIKIFKKKPDYRICRECKVKKHKYDFHSVLSRCRLCCRMNRRYVIKCEICNVEVSDISFKKHLLTLKHQKKFKDAVLSE